MFGKINNNFKMTHFEQSLYKFGHIWTNLHNFRQVWTISDIFKRLPILKVPSGVTVMRPFVVAGKIIPGLDSLIQKSVGVGFPEAMQSREAGAPSATFWSVGSTKNIGGAVKN